MTVSRSESAGCINRSIGPQLATADDVIARRARYADTPGGYADRKTLANERSRNA